MTYDFERMPDSGLIVIRVVIGKKNILRMIFDTGCTNTTIDSNALYLAGYELKQSINSVEIETANGIVKSEVFEINRIDALGITKNSFAVQVYDFLAHGVFSDYDGLLGIDFVEGLKFCIDTNLNHITIAGV